MRIVIWSVGVAAATCLLGVAWVVLGLPVVEQSRAAAFAHAVTGPPSMLLDFGLFWLLLRGLGYRITST